MIAEGTVENYYDSYTDPNNPPHPEWVWRDGRWQNPRSAPIEYNTMQTTQAPPIAPHYYPIESIPGMRKVRVVYAPNGGSATPGTPVPMPTPIESDLLFGFPRTYVYIAGVGLVIAAYVAYSMMSSK